MPRYSLGRMRRGPASVIAAGGEVVSSHISAGSKGCRSVPRRRGGRVTPTAAPQQQQQTQRAEALPVGTPQIPPVGQQKEKLSNQATGGQPVETKKFVRQLVHKLHQATKKQQKLRRVSPNISQTIPLYDTPKTDP
jgi:hypothetical protein